MPDFPTTSKDFNINESQIKLFLSVDISGSTKLKNTHNYSLIQKKCADEADIVNHFREDKEEKITADIVFKKHNNSIYYQDWSKIVKDLLNDFNSKFNGYLEGDDIYPWKVCGDELIYCIKVEKRQDVYLYVLAFYKTLRYHDKKCKEADLIRLKGSAWTAGFPVRNRIVETPIPKLYLQSENKKDDFFPYPHFDYAGPEMDIGFRIGKYTYPGLIVVSLELAYILTDSKTQEIPGEKFSIINVGWRVLKGVWNGKKYPIFWLKMPDTFDKSKDFYYKVYNYWDREESSLLKIYDTNYKDPSLCCSHDDLKKIIEEFKETECIVKPYFCKDGDFIPPEHQKLIDFMNILDKLNRPEFEEVRITQKEKDFLNNPDSVLSDIRSKKNKQEENDDKAHNC